MVIINGQEQQLNENNKVTINNHNQTLASTTISLQNDPNNNKNKLTSKGEDSGSVLQPVLVPQLGYSTIQNILDINKKLIQVLIEYQNYGWIEDPDFIIYQRRLQTNLNYLATVADNYLNFNKISIPDLSPVTLSKKLKKKIEEKNKGKGKENEQNMPCITNGSDITINKAATTATTTTTTVNDFTNLSSDYPKKIKKENMGVEEEDEEEGGEDEEEGGKEKEDKKKKMAMEEKDQKNRVRYGNKRRLEDYEETNDHDTTLSPSSDDILPTLPPPYFISDPNIYDQTELDNVSPIDPGSYVATQPFVIPEHVKRPPAVDKSKDVGYLTPGVTRAIFKGRWEGLTLGGNNNTNNNSNN